MKKFLILILVLVLIVFYFVKRRDDKIKSERMLYNLYNINDFDDNEVKYNLDGVDQVYCITTPERKFYAENILNNFNINVIYFDSTEKSIFNSFLMCIIHALLNENETIVILEDSVTINISKTKLINVIEKFKKSNFVIFCMLDSSCRYALTLKTKYLQNFSDYTKLKNPFLDYFKSKAYVTKTPYFYKNKIKHIING